MDWINEFAQNSEMPLLAAFALGLLTAIAPCPLATNITATAYIAKNVESQQKTLLSGILYTFGRVLTYTLIGTVIYFGVSTFEVSKLLQGNGEKFIGFVMVFIGLIMLNIIQFNFNGSNKYKDLLTERFKDKGLLGSFVLGAVFALAFCPYSGALFFVMLIPMMLSASMGLGLPIVFALGTGLPVIILAFVIAFSVQKIGIYFKAITKFESFMRIFAGVIFILTGFYYINLYFNLIQF